MLFVKQNYYFPRTFIPFVEKYLLKERRGSVAGIQGTRTTINKTPKLTRNDHGVSDRQAKNCAM